MLQGAGAQEHVSLGQMLSFSLQHFWKPPTSSCTLWPSERAQRAEHLGGEARPDRKPRGRTNMMSGTGHLGQSCLPTVEREISAELSGQEKKKITGSELIRSQG